mmetsp:Transcript_54155/g.62279  ORF Transcript_54155/g.62279 Transcript_54155/m.62279 type:complete len:197 (+) Transcript_54155:26-616(+)
MLRRGAHAAATAAVVGLNASSRCFGGRAVPWVPQGTMMDFTSSPRHAALNDLQRDLDLAAGRPVTERVPVAQGPVIMSADGTLKPYTETLPGGSKRHYQHPAAAGQRPRSVFDMDESDMTPHEELTHEQEIRKRLYANRVDSYGPQPRKPVRPPPPVDPMMMPEAYHAPTPQITPLWFGIMGVTVVSIYCMAKYGR